MASTDGRAQKIVIWIWFRSAHTLTLASHVFGLIIDIVVREISGCRCRKNCLPCTSQSHRHMLAVWFLVFLLIDRPFFVVHTQSDSFYRRPKSKKKTNFAKFDRIMECRWLIIGSGWRPETIRIWNNQLLIHLPRSEKYGRNSAFSVVVSHFAAVPWMNDWIKWRCVSFRSSSKFYYGTHYAHDTCDIFIYI